MMEYSHSSRSATGGGGARAKACIERLEARQLMAATPGPNGPVITGEKFIGPVGGVTALVLQFDQALDPSTANNIKAYHIGRNFGSSSDSGGFNPIGFFSQPKPASSGNGGGVLNLPAIEKASATSSTPQVHPFASVGTVSYDDTSHTVTIFAAKPFNAKGFLRFVRVTGTGVNAVRGANGLALDGDQNGKPGGTQVIRYRFFNTKSFAYTDARKNRVVLKVQGVGRIFAFLPRLNPSPDVFLTGTDPGTTIVTGTFKPSAHGDGTTTIQELSGASMAQIQLPPEITVTYSQP